MKKAVYIFALALVGIAAVAYICWTCSFSYTGIAWFPGFFVAVFCGIKMLELCNSKKSSRL